MSVPGPVTAIVEGEDHAYRSPQHDGSAKTQLTNIDATDTWPRFSPDGETIVFARDKTYRKRLNSIGNRE
jgi:dipeptidyl aminopeptidase/acylaminoacyl peptidase